VLGPPQLSATELYCGKASNSWPIVRVGVAGKAFAAAIKLVAVDMLIAPGMGLVEPFAIATFADVAGASSSGIGVVFPAELGALVPANGPKARR
jgi:hypothetical protein